MSLVIDASITLSWSFEDEASEVGEAALEAVLNGGAFVPSVWKLEVANGLGVAMRRQRIDQTYRDGTIRRLATMGIRLDPETDANAWTTTLRLADRFDLTIYDATYLELAQRLILPLATLDKALLRSAKGLGVSLFGT